MRSLKKDTKKLYVAKRLPSAPIKDENGFDTGEYIKVYDELLALNLNVKPISDKIECQMFGEDVDSVLKITYTMFDSEGYEITEFDAVWLGAEPNGVLTEIDPYNPMNNNYIVIKTIIFRSQNIAYIKKIAGSPHEN